MCIHNIYTLYVIQKQNDKYIKYINQTKSSIFLDSLQNTSLLSDKELLSKRKKLLRYCKYQPIIYLSMNERRRANVRVGQKKNNTEIKKIQEYERLCVKVNVKFSGL